MLLFQVVNFVCVCVCYSASIIMLPVLGVLVKAQAISHAHLPLPMQIYNLCSSTMQFFFHVKFTLAKLS